jgi:hypothetical protein
MNDMGAYGWLSTFRLALLLVNNLHWKNGSLKDFTSAALKGKIDRTMIDMTDKDLRKFLTENGLTMEEFGWS